ncbi:MAG: C39 family peptidase [Dysgonamonadaceae bacterium]|nr:C39 family peptidase [Dysgonamonadaceae bacterium]
MQIPAVSAQDEKNHSVTAEEAFKHANTRMIRFIATDIHKFGSWKGASIDPKPLELYDINGQKLYYQFSVYENNKTIGRIDVGANKTLGQPIQVIEFNPIPYNMTEVMEKSIETAKNNYPTGEIKSTNMVVYSYPRIGAMTVVKDKTTGDEHRIFVDAYTLDVVPDKPITETKPGVCSIYEQKSKNEIDENLKEWQKSDELTKSIEHAATNKGVNISLPVTEEDIKKLSDDLTVVATSTSKYLDTILYGQENDHYCAPACGQMIAKYYGVTHTQNFIYQKMGPGYDTGGNVYNKNQLNYYQSSTGLNKPHSTYVTAFTFDQAISEINYNRPFVSIRDSHSRVCSGYLNDYPDRYLAIDDPLPENYGYSYMEEFGSEDYRVYVRS